MPPTIHLLVCSVLYTLWLCLNFPMPKLYCFWCYCVSLRVLSPDGQVVWDRSFSLSQPVTRVVLLWSIHSLLWFPYSLVFSFFPFLVLPVFVFPLLLVCVCPWAWRFTIQLFQQPRFPSHSLLDCSIYLLFCQPFFWQVAPACVSPALLYPWYFSLSDRQERYSFT